MKDFGHNHLKVKLWKTSNCKFLHLLSSFKLDTILSLFNVYMVISIKMDFLHHPFFMLKRSNEMMIKLLLYHMFSISWCWSLPETINMVHSGPLAHRYIAFTYRAGWLCSCIWMLFFYSHVVGRATETNLCATLYCVTLVAH